MIQPYGAALSHVFNRGRPPIAFLDGILSAARTWPAEIYAPNLVPVDIFTVIKSSLATPAGKDGAGTPIYHWDSLLHRKAALCEAMRVHGMFESSGNWQQGVDRSNPASLRDPRKEETGAFQVSFNSTGLANGAMMPFAKAHGIDTPAKFIRAMKADTALACEYYARLVRVRIDWAGPLLRHGEDSIYPWLRPAAMKEFMGLLA